MKSQTGHWDEIYATKTDAEVSWYTPHLAASLSLIEYLNLNKETPIIDVGAGVATFVDDLLIKGFKSIHLLDISNVALAATRKRLGDQSSSITWINRDITSDLLFTQSYGLWHDRAVFHFLTEVNEVKAYLKNLNKGLCVNGYAIIATFSKDGPKECSRLPVKRYSISELEEVVGNQFNLIKSSVETHITSWGSTQLFTYCLFQKLS